MTESDYRKLTRPHARALRQLLLDFEFFIADAGNLNVFSLSGRIKSHQSALDKQQRIGVAIEDIQDLAGIRLVLATSDEVEVIAQFLRDEEKRDQLTITTDKAISKTDGYRARHMVLAVGHGITHSVFKATVEVQLQTILQHAYNFVSRAWVYKSARDLSKDWQSRFQQVARTLSTLDGTIAELHSELLAAASQGSDGEPLTPFSFQRIVKEIFSENVSLDQAVWFTRFLIDLHCTTNGDVRGFLGSAKIWELRDRVANLRSARARSLMSDIATMPLYEFWGLMGVRVDAAHHLLDTLEEQLREDD